jgi:hypothetical protein
MYSLALTTCVVVNYPLTYFVFSLTYLPCTQKHRQIHIYIHTYIHTSVYTHIHSHTHTYIYMYTYTYIHIHSYKLTYIPTVTHTYDYIHTGTHTHCHVSGVPWLIITGSVLDLLALPIQLQSIIRAHNQRLPKTRSIPYWTTSVFSSAVTDLVLIYESVTSSASIVRWLTLHSWALNSLTSDLWLTRSSLRRSLYIFYR